MLSFNSKSNKTTGHRKKLCTKCTSQTEEWELHFASGGDMIYSPLMKDFIELKYKICSYYSDTN